MTIAPELAQAITDPRAYADGTRVDEAFKAIRRDRAASLRRRPDEL